MRAGEAAPVRAPWVGPATLGLPAQGIQRAPHPPPRTRRLITTQDPELLSFIDIECYCWSTVLADLTPMINAGMVFCDRHYGGINYPVVSVRGCVHMRLRVGGPTAAAGAPRVRHGVSHWGSAAFLWRRRWAPALNTSTPRSSRASPLPQGGVGLIPERMAEGIRERGGYVQFKSNVKEIVVEGEGEAARAVGVRLADGRLYRGKFVVSNATRWDTFESMMGEDKLPESGARRRRMLLAYPAALRAARTLCCPPTPRRKCAPPRHARTHTPTQSASSASATPRPPPSCPSTWG